MTKPFGGIHIKGFFKCTGICAAFLAVLIFLNGLSGLIPVSAMRNNLDTSADYYMQLTTDGSTFINHVDGMYQTSEHVYADAVLMNIIACFDGADFWRSTLTVPYHYDGLSASTSLFHALQGAETNRLYSRYWHGTLMFTRLELLFTDARGIHIINAVVLYALVAAFMAVCIRTGRKRLAFCYLASFLLTTSFFAFWTIEYMSCFSISLLAGIAVVCTPAQKLRGWRLNLLFMLTAVATAFFDFFTNETMTFLVPAVCLITRRLEKPDATFKSILLETVKTGCIWLATWAVTFALRWVISALTPGALTLSDILSRGVEWAVGVESNIILNSTQLTALYKNLYCLFPFNSYEAVFLAAGAALFVLVAVFLIFRVRVASSWTPALVLVLLALVPYARYLALAKHSMGHYRFAYRAQLSSVFCALSFLCAAIRPILRHQHPQDKRRRT